MSSLAGGSLELQKFAPELASNRQGGKKTSMKAHVGWGFRKDPVSDRVQTWLGDVRKCEHQNGGETTADRGMHSSDCVPTRALVSVLRNARAALYSVAVVPISCFQDFKPPVNKTGGRLRTFLNSMSHTVRSNTDKGDGAGGIIADSSSITTTISNLSRFPKITCSFGGDMTRAVSSC
jgi:hypothetical protein